jgi:VanZ like family
VVPGGILRWVPVVVISIAVFPLGLLVARRLEGRAVRRGVPPGVARRRALAEVGMVGGTAPWIWMILTPLPAPRDVRLTPLRDVAELLADTPAAAFFQIVGNLLVFAALGFFAAARWRIGVLAVVGLAAAASLTVEALQYALALGRVSSVDDVLLNAAGAGIAALLSRRYWPAAPMEVASIDGERREDGRPLG